MPRTPIMLLGCTSDAGKSFLATTLCRHLANRGVRVAPFRARDWATVLDAEIERVALLIAESGWEP